jgi:DNA-binding IclR family transcriptional regulator
MNDAGINTFEADGLSLQQAVMDLIRRYVDSMETLEIILLLQRAPDTFWTASAIDSHFGMRQGTAERRLQGLLENRLVTRGKSGGYRYAPEDEELRATVSALAIAYAERPSLVRRFIAV